jgi:NADH-quinone oxidoreductase subunit A
MAPYGYIALFLVVVALVFGPVAIMVGLLFRPRRSNAVTESTYECGIKTTGPSWVQFRVGYYLYALVFVVFDVEAVFLYPWAVAFKQLGLYAFIEAIVFVGILVFGLIYAFQKKALEWK